MKMEAIPVTVAITIVIVTIATLWLKLLNWVWFRPKKLEKLMRAQGFDGNSYRLLIGDLKEFLEMGKEARSKPINPVSHDIFPYVLPFSNHIINKYGKNSFMWFGPSLRLNVADPELIKEILSKPNIFHKPHPEAFRDMLLGGLLVSEDEKWVKHRRIINPAFHLEKLKNMLPAIHSCCSDMVNKWDKLISANGSSEVDVWPYFENLTGDMISRAAFDGNHEEGRKIFQLHKEQVHITVQLTPLIYIPGWRFLPTKRVKRYKQVSSEIQSLLRVIINKRERAIEMGEAKNDDLLGILLESNSEEIKENGVGMSMEEVMEECKLFYFAGSETTADLLVWTMVLLSIHQNWQIRAREEVLQVFENREPDSVGLNHLKVVTMILFEVLRLYPPVVLLPRAISKEVKLGSMILPAGVQFLLNTIQVQNDREIWGEDATDFNPERFSKGVSSATKGKVSFLPFGAGPRICIGQNFAMIEAKMAITMILRRFSLDLSPSYKHSPDLIVTIRPQFGAQIVFHKI